MEEEKEELEHRVRVLESIEIISPYKIESVINEITNYLVGA